MEGVNLIMKNYKLAAALRYSISDNAPIVVAKGKRYLAKKIIEQAKLNNIPIKIDVECAKQLIGIELEHEIPAELYEVVAKILIFVNIIDKKI